MSDITKQSLSELVKNIKDKKLSSEEVTRAFIDRSEKSKELNTYITEDYSSALNKAKKLAGDLNSIFEFIEKLNELKTDNVEPLASVAETTLKLRSDKVKSKDIREQIIKNSPQDNQDYFVVPKVIE